jgi:transposase-like protein
LEDDLKNLFQNRRKPGHKKKSASAAPIATITCPVCKSDEVIERAKKDSGDSMMKCKLCEWEFVERMKPPEKEVAEEELSKDSLATLNRINNRTIQSRSKKERRTKKIIPENLRPDPFFRLLMAVIFIHFIPIIQLPFTWLQTYFHELSHGLAALAIGADIEQVFIKTNGSGLIKYFYAGNNRAVISWSGYTGAAIWGVLIYLSALKTKNKHSHSILAFLFLTIVASTALWVRDEETLIIMWVISLVLLASFSLQTRRLEARWMKFFVQFSGLYVLCDAILSPLVLLNYNAANDSITLEKLTQLPNHFWIVQWFMIAAFGLYFLWATTYTRNRRLRQRRKA